MAERRLEGQVDLRELAELYGDIDALCFRRPLRLLRAERFDIS
jgi:hypothetical protein